MTLGEGYDGVWLPTVGRAAVTRRSSRARDRAHEQAESFRYNLATSTAVVPTGLGPGDVYRFTAVRPAGDGQPRPTRPRRLVTDAAVRRRPSWTPRHVRGPPAPTEPMARVFAIAEHLKHEGKYSDGVAEAEKIYHPGHNVKRLGDEFANAPIMVGNDEQYAAIMALLANNVGVPARVVMGAVVPERRRRQGPGRRRRGWSCRSPTARGGRCPPRPSWTRTARPSSRRRTSRR